MSGEIKASRQEAYSPYPDASAEIADHLLRLNGILRAAVQRFRRSHTLEQRNGLDGVAVFDDEIDRFLNTSLDAAPHLGKFRSDGEFPGSNEATDAEDRLRCERRAQASALQQIELPIETLRQRFELSPVELDALLHCLAVELHSDYGRVYAYLNNDLTRQRPSVALIVNNLAANWAEHLVILKALGQRSALFRSNLLVETRPGGDHLTMELAVEPSVLELVLGGSAPRDERDLYAKSDDEDLMLAPNERQAIDRVTRYLQQTPPGALGTTIVVVSGAAGVGRRTVAGAICRELRRKLRSTGKSALLASFLPELPSWLRTARLTGEVPAVYVPTAAAEEPTQLPRFIAAMVDARCALGFLLVEAAEPPRIPANDSARLVRIHLGAPKVGLRATTWRRVLRRRGLECTEEVLSTVAAVYSFNVGRIHKTVDEADLRLQIDDPGSRRLELSLLAQVCREQTHHQLDRLAQALPIRHGWSDIVLPPDELCRLKEIANAVRNRDRVMEEWGFDQKVSAGRGVNAIFFGPSGTGKTMAASILAGDLGMAIYRIDLSRIVSKYIGETERNLDTLFEEARSSYAVLFFDEAEALFGKRSEVKDAHDRYANIEVAYLLQRMEAFDGVAILATNLRKHMDTAFLRRLQFAVEFPLPTMAERLQIWRRVWPAEAEMARDVDLEFMAGQLELSGGHIRNVALTAAFLASEERSPISMRHIVAATRREFQKLGRSCVPDQFGPYASLLDITVK